MRGVTGVVTCRGWLLPMYLATIAGLAFMSSVRGDIDLETALAAHESTVDSLVSFEMRLEVRAPSPSIARNLVAMARGTEVPLALFQTCRWVVDGRQERIQTTPVALAKSATRDDTVRNGSVQETLRNWDPDNPPRISPSKQGRVYAEIREQSTDFRTSDPAQPALIFPRFSLSEPRAGLRALVKRFRDKSVRDSNSDVLITLLGDDLGFYKSDERLTITLSKSHGFLIRSIACEKTQPISATGYGQKWMRRQYTVVDFQVIGGEAVPFPRTVRYSLIDAFKGAELSYSINTFTCLTANVPIGQGAFRLEFPKDVVVLDMVEDPKTIKWYLIGDNGARIPVRSRDQLARYDRHLARTPVSRWVLVVNFLVAATLVLLIGRALWRKRK